MGSEELDQCHFKQQGLRLQVYELVKTSWVVPEWGEVGSQGWGVRCSTGGGWTSAAIRCKSHVCIHGTHQVLGVYTRERISGSVM